MEGGTISVRLCGCQRPWRDPTPTAGRCAAAPPQGWLPFCFTFLGFSLAFKLVLGITLFSVYSAAILYRLWEHSDVQGTATLAGAWRWGAGCWQLLLERRRACTPATRGSQQGPPRAFR